MVNTEEFTKRLHRIMDYYDLSAASFADKIDVGRSSISHLLSGRNKPSLDFVMKIIDAFPDVELYWLLNGKGTFPKNPGKEPIPISSPAPSSKPTPKDLFSEEPKKATLSAATSEKNIKRIVIFYSDGTFEAFEN
ncbi:helix-turn-helix domain-containing protein [Salinimicrobium flavum]|uniref:Helix-turn-helix domain-containing protein n=1 Tax=Salinimicrobium flavum TaxID=1737065 RepID=A0ABW5IZ95_9FLAO